MENLIEEVVSKNKKILETRGITKWTGSKYESIKLAARTTSGDFGEDSTSEILTGIGYPSRVVNKGKGSFDILMLEKILLEHKLATEDTNLHFQFNGIKKSVEYDYVFCLGFSPNELFFTIISKDFVVKTLTTTMVKDTVEGFKYTVSKKKMISLTVENLTKEIEKIVK